MRQNTSDRITLRRIVTLFGASVGCNSVLQWFISLKRSDFFVVIYKGIQLFSSQFPLNQNDEQTLPAYVSICVYITCDMVFVMIYLLLINDWGVIGYVGVRRVRVMTADIYFMCLTLVSLMALSWMFKTRVRSLRPDWLSSRSNTLICVRGQHITDLIKINC